MVTSGWQGAGALYVCDSGQSKKKPFLNGKASVFNGNNQLDPFFDPSKSTSFTITSVMYFLTPSLSV